MVSIWNHDKVKKFRKGVGKMLKKALIFGAGAVVGSLFNKFCVSIIAHETLHKDDPDAKAIWVSYAEMGYKIEKAFTKKPLELAEVVSE